jgi:hypothetical protein
MDIELSGVKFYVLYDGSKKIIGYTPSMNEADALCDKHPDWQWDVKSAQRCVGVYRQLTIHD